MKIKFRNTILCKENHSREIMANMIDKELNLSWKNIEKKTLNSQKLIIRNSWISVCALLTAYK